MPLPFDALTSDEASQGRNDKEGEEDSLFCNKIFLNFTRKCRSPLRSRRDTLKVTELFRYLSEREDLQEMKVSGWQDEGTDPEEEEEEEGKEGLESYYGGDSPKEGGQRFAMSRDFWYRKLNTLKAQKLDEAALETKDLPPEDGTEDSPPFRRIRHRKEYSSDVPEEPERILQEIDAFEQAVAKPVERELRRRFVNVYDNRKRLEGGCFPPTSPRKGPLT